jgi:hypothetical protein
VGSSAETAEASEANFCVPYLRNGALVEVIGSALSAMTSEDARGFVEHCGYRMPVQSLW